MKIKLFYIIHIDLLNYEKYLNLKSEHGCDFWRKKLHLKKNFNLNNLNIFHFQFLQKKNCLSIVDEYMFVKNSNA